MIPAISLGNAVFGGAVVSCFVAGTVYYSMDKASSLKNAVIRKMNGDIEEENGEEHVHSMPIPYMKLVEVGHSHLFYE